MGRQKIDDTKLKSLLREKKSYRAIAKILGVSATAIFKRVKRLGLKDIVCKDSTEGLTSSASLPVSLQALTSRQREFVLGITSGLTKVQACMQSYNVSNLESAKQLSKTLMRNSRVRDAVGDLMETAGLGRTYRILKLKEFCEHPDPEISLRSLGLAIKIADDAGERRGSNSKDDFQFHTYDLSDLKPAKKENGVNDV